MGISSPLLKQAGFVKSKIAIAIAVKYVARLDGFSQFWQLSTPINYSTGDSITMECSQPGASFDVLISDKSNTFLVRRNTAGNVTFGGCAISINGTSAISDSTPWPVGYSVFELTLTSNVTVVDFGIRTDVKTGHFEGVIKRFSDSIGHNIQLVNKAQGATQLAVAGNVNATMVNFSTDVWEQLYNANI